MPSPWCTTIASWNPHAAGVAAKARAREENEAEKREALRSGRLSLDVFNLRGGLEELGLKYD